MSVILTDDNRPPLASIPLELVDSRLLVNMARIHPQEWKKYQSATDDTVYELARVDTILAVTCPGDGSEPSVRLTYYAPASSGNYARVCVGVRLADNLLESLVFALRSSHSINVKHRTLGIAFPYAYSAVRYLCRSEGHDGPREYFEP